jgi:predicted amidophosphoribosyltransferase
MVWFRKKIYAAPGIPLPGPFDVGFALDFHSVFKDDKWHRTIVGEQVYQLKYQGHAGSGRWLTKVCLQFLNRLSPPWQINIVLAMPPSRPRKKFTAVEIVASKIARKLNADFLFRELDKLRPTPYMKEAGTREQKHNIIHQTMVVHHPEKLITKRILLLDDLFESGATSSEAVRVLRETNPDWIGFLAWTVAA